MKWKALILTLLLGSAGAFAGELEDVLEKYYKALGGKDLLAKITSMKASGTFTMSMGGQKMESPFTMVVKDLSKVRLDAKFQGTSITQCYDGEKGWRLMPMMSPDPQDMNEKEAADVVDMANIHGDLYNYEERGSKLEYMGKEDVEGTETHKIKVVTADGREKMVFLDAEYYLPIKSTGKTNFGGMDVDVETVISDYKKIDGYMMSHAAATTPAGGQGGMEFKIIEVELNPKIDDSIFQKPEKKEAVEQQ